MTDLETAPCSSIPESTDDNDNDDVVDAELLSLRECSDDDTERRPWRRSLSSCRRSLPCSLINCSRVLVSFTWHTCRLCTQYNSRH